MKKMIKVIPAALFLLISINALAQRPQNTRPLPQRSAAERVEMEKKSIRENVSNLTDDQVLMIDQVFEDYAKSLSAARADSNGNMQQMREKFKKARDSKEASMKEILDEKQQAEYNAYMEKRQQNRRQGDRRGGRQ